MFKVFTVWAFLFVAGCATCPNEQELLDIGSEAQFEIGHLYLGFEANCDVLPENDQSAVRAIGSNFASQLRKPAYDDAYVYVAIGKYEGDTPGDNDLALRRFEHVEQLLREGEQLLHDGEQSLRDTGLGSRKIVGVAELPKRDQLSRAEDGVYIGLRCD